MIPEASAVRGTISSVAFTSGDRFVVGNWASPLGRLLDVMWVRADGCRLLLTTDDAAAVAGGSGPPRDDADQDAARCRVQ